MSDGFSVGRQAGIVIVTLDRPERRNALHPAAHHALEAQFDALAADDSVRVVILTGTGDKAFCAGYDLLDNLETGVMEIAARGFGGLTFRTDFPHPLIAAVNGDAMGGGFEMALACDIIIAARTARFALPEPKVGWVALGGGIQRLPRAIGTKRAAEIILTGRFVGAEEGLALGFVNEVVEPGETVERALAIAEAIQACAPIAIRASKAALYAGLDQPDLATALKSETYPLAQVVLDSADAEEGKRAFAERRPPRWEGR
ncbi:MAG: enoyl-CoA hydratase [Sphingomonadales bacterium]|nr:enoyl-CoA hydratase [Sphingomonadales bacterium]